MAGLLSSPLLGHPPFGILSQSMGSATQGHSQKNAILA
jgi:hypothetical protein